MPAQARHSTLVQFVRITNLKPIFGLTRFFARSTLTARAACARGLSKREDVTSMSLIAQARAAGGGAVMP